MKICIYVHVLLSVTNGFWSICCFMGIMQCCFAHIPSKSENATLHFFCEKVLDKKYLDIQQRICRNSVNLSLLMSELCSFFMF